jgi:hypothetical protein
VVSTDSRVSRAVASASVSSMSVQPSPVPRYSGAETEFV